MKLIDQPTLEQVLKNTFRNWFSHVTELFHLFLLVHVFSVLSSL